MIEIGLVKAYVKLFIIIFQLTAMDIMNMFIHTYGGIILTHTQTIFL